MRIKMIILGVVFTCCTLLLINTKPVKLELDKVYFSATCPVPRQGGMRWPNLSRLKIRNYEIQFAA